LETTAGPDSTSVDVKTTPGAYQCFRVRAVNSAGDSAWTPYGCTTTPPLTVLGTQPWIDTGVDLAQGTVISINASGTVKIAGSGPGKSPAGNSTCTADQSFIAPGLACWSLIGRIGNGPLFAVGTGATITAINPGVLWLGINDQAGSFGDNPGTWAASIKKGQQQRLGVGASCSGAVVRTHAGFSRHLPCLHPDQGLLAQPPRGLVAPFPQARTGRGLSFCSARNHRP
jgi:PA-IL-like protein